MTRRLPLLPVMVHSGVMVWAAWLFWNYFSGGLGVNPIQAITRYTGKTALVLLVLSLACTPANTLFGARQALKIRRPLGLYAFLFAATHFFMFVGLDYLFDWELLWLDIAEKRYVWVGFTALLILLALAVTSFNWWKKHLGKNWKRLHRLAYLAGVLVVVHYAWVVKGDVLRLQGDIFQPIAFGVAVALLLLLRVPVVKKTLRGLAAGSKDKKKTLVEPGRGQLLD